MTKKQLTEAVKAYQPILEESGKDAVIAAMKDAEYSDEDIEKVLSAIVPPEDEKPVHYQEWEVKITNGEAEKLKMRRAVVKISEEEAEILNVGILKGSNTYGLMYFLPE